MPIKRAKVNDILKQFVTNEISFNNNQRFEIVVLSHSNTYLKGVGGETVATNFNGIISLCEVYESNNEKIQFKISSLCKLLHIELIENANKGLS